MVDQVINAVPFAVYVTGMTDAEQLRQALQSGSLSPDAAWALHIVDAAVERYPIRLRSEIDNLRDYFAEYDDTASTTRATAMRARCGGGLAPVPVADTESLQRYLAILARDLFPILLLQPSTDGYSIDPYEAPSWDGHWGLGTGAPHPAATRFTELMMKQPWFTSSTQNDFSERVDVGRFKSGWYRGFKVGRLHTSLLNEAFRSTSGTGPLTAERFLEAALRALSIFERTMMGERVEVTVLHGPTGLHLAPDASITLPWGRLRRLREEEFGLLQGDRLRDDSPVSTTTVIMQGRGYLTRVLEHAPSSWFEPKAPAGLDELERLQLGLLLASGGCGTAVAVWCVSPDVAHLDHIPDERDAFLLPYMAADVGSIGSDELLEVSYWCSLIDAKHHSEIDTAARRLLRARLERLRPDDGLVDAVIALESLFPARRKPRLHSA